MNLIPNTAEKIEVDGSTVDFYKEIEDSLSTFYFDTSECGPPEPMVNAMAGLQLLDKNSKLIMINHKAPMGLFPKVQQNFNYEIIELDDGRHKIVFTHKEGTTNQTDFSQTSCSG